MFFFVLTGPGLLAFTLMMVALSLRMWRRNGIACDELLFLPGTPHGESATTTTSNEAASSMMPNSGTSTHSSTSRGETNHNNNVHRTPRRHLSSQNSLPEGDVAAGGAVAVPSGSWDEHQQQQRQQPPAILPSSSFPRAGAAATAISPPSNRSRMQSHDSSQSSIHEFLNAWDDDDDDDDVSDLEQLVPPSASSGHHHYHDHNRDNSAGLRDTSERSTTTTATTTTTTRHNNNTMIAAGGGGATSFRDQHPRMTRIGTFFFFRSATSSTQNAAYAPSGPSVMGAALDLSMPVLINFHLFIQAWNHLDNTNNNNNDKKNDDGRDHHDSYDDNGPSSATTAFSETPAKILPMIFLSVLIVRSVVPPGRRGRFWSTIRYTISAPLHAVPFRDAYIGDILTSLVRPLQDVLFALAYYVTVMVGTITSNYSLSESSIMLQHSWWLHNVVLPSCALLPLWWKFLQTLRQAYDTKQRWPYLGNAVKYLSAGIVILYGMTHREDQRSAWWIPAFGITLLYQIFWDTVMDWGLFELLPRDTDAMDVSEPSWLNRFSSASPHCTWLLTVKRVVLPIIDALRLKLGRIPSFSQIRLRQTRLYKSEKFYWRIFAYNTAFRFCWMLCFIPAYHFSSSEKVTTFSSDTKSYVGVLLPIAEIVRRTLWGFLHLEKETIRMHEGGRLQQYDAVDTAEAQDEEYEMSSVSVHSTSKARLYLPPWLNSQQQMHQDAAMAMSSSSNTWHVSKWFQYSDETRDNLFKAELAAWAVAFVLLGALATT
jgi:EXS family